jgi:hypothetical protein
MFDNTNKDDRFYCNVCGRELQKYIDNNNKIRVVECPTCKDTTGYISRDSTFIIKSEKQILKEPVFIHNTFKEVITKQWQKKRAKRGKKF